MNASRLELFGWKHRSLKQRLSPFPFPASLTRYHRLYTTRQETLHSSPVHVHGEARMALSTWVGS